MAILTFVPRGKSYHVPEGRFPAKILNVAIKEKNEVKQECTIYFSVKVLGSERYDYRAKAIHNLNLQPDSPLRKFTEGLLGKNFFEERSDNFIDLDAILQGRECEVEIEHGQHDAEKHKFPFVKVKSICPLKQPQEPQAKKETIK